MEKEYEEEYEKEDQCTPFRKWWRVH